jgi:S-formylglutathione hydrolase FrmB
MLHAAEVKPFMSFLNPPARPIPMEEHLSYDSASMKIRVGFNIYLPPGYGDAGNTNRYPVIYWLHGRGCTESSDQFPVATVDSAIRSKTIPSLIFIYASGGGMSFYSDSSDGKWMSETTIIQELIPHVDSHYRTIPNRGGRAVQGMSMGGFGAMKLAFKHPEMFGSVVAFAGGFRAGEEMRNNEANRQILERVFDNDPARFESNRPNAFARANQASIRNRLGIKMLVGMDDSLLENNRALHAALTQLNLAHEYSEIPGIQHDLPKLSAWLGTAGLEFAARHFASSAARSAKAPGNTAADDELAPAMECRERGGLPNVLAKLRSGAEVRIGYLGGSITAQDGWRPKSLAWFRERFPSAKTSEINAAIGGTGSDLGVFRLQHDVLDLSPDLLFVEFAVNDSGAAPAQIHRCMEGIVRQTWKNNPATDICFVYTLTGDMLKTLQQDRFPRAASAMEKLAEHYAIPSIHMGLEVARLEKAGKLIFKGDRPKSDANKAALGDKILFSPDSVHPYTDSGHALYLEAVVRSMAAIEKVGQPGPHALPAPFVADNWEKATLIPLSRAKLSSGWKKLKPETDSLAKSFGNRMPELWKAGDPGESISFRFRGTTVRLYDLLGPDCGQVTIALDDRKTVVSPRFDAYCTYHRLATLSIGEALTDTVHEVTITIHPDQPDKAKILSQRNEKMDNPKRFDGTAWYAGAILLIGEMAEFELIRDRDVQQSLILLSAQPGKRVPCGTLAGPSAGKAVWDVCQWSSRFPFQESLPERLAGGAWRYGTPGKSILIGKPDSDGISMAVSGGIEYDGRARQMNEPWVHLLLQQEIEKSPSIAEMHSARFHIEARLKSSKKIETPDYSPGLHAAQFQVFFSVQNRNRESAGYGQYLWFGIPVYDDRHRFPLAHKTQDTGGTGMFIFTPSGEAFTSQSAHDKQWITIDKDILPLMREGLETAWSQGFLKDSHVFADYRIGGMNIGWEVPGLFDVDLQFRNLSLRTDLGKP